ncbi:MAG: MBL fold metallo-hydrolase [Desulfurococcaceae archaeon]
MSKPSLSKVEVLILVDDYAGFTELIGEHGFSALITIHYDDGENYRLLFDTGRTGRGLLENIKLLNVDLSNINVIVLSHRHHDHTGGLPSLVNLLKGKLIVAHTDIIKPCYVESKGFLKFNAGLSPDTKKAIHEFELVLSRKPLELAPNVWFLGEIERYYDNSYAVKQFKTIQNGELIDDPMLDDTGLAVRLGDKALVIAGCSHSGISNIARSARKITGVDDVIILGGLHLASANPEDAERVVKELLLNEGLIEAHVGHCTGLLGESKLVEKLKENMHKIHSGYKVVFEL